jgi:hypothetical protein
VRGSDIPVRTDGLQLDEPRGFQRLFWMLQRCAWIGFGAVIAVALLGLTGAGGPFARHLVSMPEGSLDVPTITRRAAPETMTLTIDAPGEPPGPERRIDISDAFSEAFQVTGIQPRPRSVVALPDGERWLFRAAGDLPIRVRVHVQPRALGRVRFDIALNGGAALSVAVVVLP